MKCGIVTVYNSINCGSFLQAYALACAVKKMGSEAVMIHQCFKGHSSTLKRHLRRTAKTILTGKFSETIELQKRRANFKKAWKKHLEITKSPETVDCFVLGSDVIWDASSAYFGGNHSFFMGMQFEEGSVISYAPSVGFSTEKDIEKAGYFKEALSNMSSVSVRDKHSLELLTPYCDKDIELVCDPTYLIDTQDYKKISKPITLDNFLFIYCFGAVPSDYASQIKNFAKERGLKTVTFGTVNSWCDVQLPYDPLTFTSLYEKADYIITNTFHGTVFSTIYEKNFAVIKNDAPKIVDVLDKLNLSDKMANGSESVSAILDSDFHYDTVGQAVAEEREKSLGYLKRAIERCSK